MMSRMEGGAGRGWDERRTDTLRENQAKTTGASKSGTEFLRDVLEASWQSNSGDVCMPAGGGEHALVTFWTTDGSRHEGMTPHMKSEMLFVESMRMVQVGCELTISLAPREGQSSGQELAEGIVVWHCPLGDEFKNDGGFGVRIQRRWPKGPGSDLVGGPKEAA